MKNNSSIIAILVVIGFIFSAPAIAQTVTDKTKTVTERSGPLKISDISGQWKIEVIDRPDSSFKGSANIPYAEGTSVIAEVIMEDKCCRGLNHARVLQDCLILIDDQGHITVTSEIKKFLLLIEGVDVKYRADDFELKRVDRNTLIGTANGNTPVRWVRDIPKLS